MCAICYAMEFLALGVHFASRQHAGYGTTSACWSLDNNTIYITSQTPPQCYYALSMLDVDSVPNVRAALKQWLKGGVMTRGMQKTVKEIVPRSGHAQPNILSLKKPKAKEAHHYSLMWAIVCFGIGLNLASGKHNLDEVMAEPDSDSQMANIFNKNPRIKIVLDSDIFATGVSASNGFHAESRIIRYLSIKQFRKDFKGPNMLGGVGIDTAFVNRYKGKLHMGSNRPACQDCAKFMDVLCVHHESRSGKPSASEHSWVHPFQLNEGKDTITPEAREQVQLQKQAKANQK